MPAGVEAHILSDEIEGESREVGKVHAALARAVARRGAPFAKPCVILSGGETTVTVKSKGGRGGRAGEFLLGCAIALQGEPGVHVLAADTDGIDGIEDNAGAIVTPDTLARAAPLGMKAGEYLDRNDAYSFFQRAGRPGGAGADLHQRQRLPRAAGAVMPQHVVFVCTGNICRSPTAHAVLRQRIAALGLQRSPERRFGRAGSLA